METMLVLVSSREVAARLEQSMFPVEGDFDNGYVYNRDVFFMEGITSDDWCPVGAISYSHSCRVTGEHHLGDFNCGLCFGGCQL